MRGPAAPQASALRQMGVDEIYRGKNDKFLTVVSNLETGEPLWFGKERKKETRWMSISGRSSEAGNANASKLPVWICGSRSGSSIEEWAPGCRIVYMTSSGRHHPAHAANDAVDEVRRAEFFPQGAEDAGRHQKGRSGCCSARWKNLAKNQRGVLSRVFQLNRLECLKAYLHKRKSGAALGLPL